MGEFHKSANTFDAKCQELAETFLGDEPKLNTPLNVNVLSASIQECIEDEIASMKARTALKGSG